MLSKNENDTLTQTGPGTPMGDLMRRFWQPVALSVELPPGGAPLSVRIFSEDLVLRSCQPWLKAGGRVWMFSPPSGGADQLDWTDQAGNAVTSLRHQMP